MKLFVTGGCGFIGSNFIQYVFKSKAGHSIVNFDKLTYAGNLRNLDAIAARPDYRFIKGDICDAHDVASALKGCDVVVHFAAESHVDRSIYEPGTAIQTNVTGTFTLLTVARELGIKRFVHVSTDEVYGSLRQDEFSSEDAVLRPNSPYSASKAASDLLVRSFVKTYGFPAVITRASNNYGPYQFPEKFVPLMISNALEDKELPVYGDGLQERDWLHVSDHCTGIMAVLERGMDGETYNIGGGNVETNLSMLRRILATLHRPESLIKHVIDRPGHDRRYALDCSKIKRELGWEPVIPLDEGLAQTIDWYRENSAWLSEVRSGDYRAYYEKHYGERHIAIAAMARVNGD
jgi:dTDP-glucose 4,6-dehydratase